MSVVHPKIVNNERIHVMHAVKCYGETDPVTELRPEIWMCAKVNMDGGYHDPQGDIPSTQYATEQEAIDAAAATNAANGWTQEEIDEVVTASKQLYDY